MLSREDQIILDKIIGGNEATFVKFFNKNKESLLSYILKQISDRTKAEEIVQDSFLDFIENLRDFRGDSSLKTYLFSIARHKTIDWIRRKKIKKILFSALPGYLIERLTMVVLDEEMEKKEVAKKIKRVFDRLPNDYQVVLRLKYIEQEKVRAIADKFRLSFKATESLIFRARRAFIKVFQSLP